MAVIMNDAAYMGFPLSIKRGNPAPVDTTAVWYNKTELETYAQSGATAYVGQVLTLVADGKCEAYMISNEAGTLIKLASTTASGDLAGDVAALQSQVADLIEKVGVPAQGETPSTGLFLEIDNLLGRINEDQVHNISAKDDSIDITHGRTTPYDWKVGVQIDDTAGNALSLVEGKGLRVEIPEVVHPEYTVEKLGSASEGAVASYALKKDGAQVGATIDIPKDLVVVSGSVVELEAGALPTGVSEAGTYIKLVLSGGDPIYIPVGSLIEYVTSGSAADDMVVVSVSGDHKVTATITDGKITLAKLDSGVQASLGKADSALQASDAPGYNDILTKTEAGTTYVAQESGKRLMSNDEGTKLAGIEAQATKNSISLNGVANANPSFYAPTTAGTAGQVLMSSGTGAPTWSEMPKSYIKFSQKNSALTPVDGKAIWNIGASTHGIVSEDIMVQLFEVATGQQVFADVVVGSDKSVRISMNASAPVAKETYKAVLFG